MNIKTSLALIASAAVLSGCGSVNSMLNETTQTHEFFRIYPKSRSKRSRYSSENDVLIEKSVKYTDFFLLSIVYV